MRSNKAVFAVLATGQGPGRAGTCKWFDQSHANFLQERNE